MPRSVRTMSVVAAAGILACSDPTGALSSRNLAFARYPESGGRSLTQFLDDWHAAVQPIASAELATKSAAVQEVHKLFQDYWNPLDFSRYSNGVENNPQYSFHDDQEYLVVQETLRYRTSGCQPFEEQQCGPYIDVVDFRPMVQVPGKKVLYQTTEHTGPIGRFIDAGITNYEIEARTVFVAESLGIMHISCATCWIFSSAPLVSTIDFTPDLTHAVVHFWLGSMTGNSTLEKIGGTWRITASQITGIID